MVLSRASIGQKLLFSFVVMALLVLLSTAIGVSGFSLVEKTKRNVVDTAIPSMIEARQVSELSSQIIASVHTLASAKTTKQHQESGSQLFNELELLLERIKTLRTDSFDTELLTELENNVQAIIDSLAELGLSVNQSINLSGYSKQQVDQLNVWAQELEQLTRTQVLNTSTITVANVTHIYGLVENNNKLQATKALDELVEVDLDLSERLHELHLLAFRTLNQIEEFKTVSDPQRIEQLQRNYIANVNIMKRRVQGVEDPTRSQQMSLLLQQLNQGKRVFETLKQKHETDIHSQTILQDTLVLFASLNTTVSQLVDQSNLTTSNAVETLSSTLLYAKWTLGLLSLVSLLIATVVIWRVIFRSVVTRLQTYSAALLSIAKGKLDVDLEVKGNDELAYMGQAILTARDTAKSLQVMVKAESKARQELEQHKAQLEQTVTERTYQLQRANIRLNQEVVNHTKARNDAEQANKAKSAFLATMSHEIRTPMNGVLGTAALMEETPLTSKQGHYLDVINRSGQTLLAILNDILDYSKIEAGHLEIRQKPFDLYRMVQDCYQLMLGKALEKDLDFRFTISDDVNTVYSGDVTRISQVINNLVGNAIKFTETGSVEIKVSREPQGELLFEISDTGIGISSEDQIHLFEAFTQGDSSHSSKGGTGLGLAICQRLVRTMQGELYLDSYIGEGSRFWFNLPLAIAELDIAQQSDLASVSKRSARVLLVEDNPVNLMVAEGFLVNMGHHVICAETGKAATQLFSDHSFDIVLLDINLPDTNGVELLRSLRAQHPMKANTVPFIAVSAHVFREEVTSYLDAGFDGYLPKPIDREALRTTIQSHLVDTDEHEGVMDDSENHEPVATLPIDDNNQQRVNVIDEAVLQQDLEILGYARMSSIVDAFDNSCEQLLQELDAAALARNDSLIRSLAHKLKGSAGSLGLQRLYQLTLDIETSSSHCQAYDDKRSELNTVVSESSKALQRVLEKSHQSDD
ncbi:TMAO reductase system sensor histidine kinase/response regulator TorS [Vibrio hippocampi]|uniref:histidine kinase n=1 Tax=Vibrio hippocampi TaxID=654686 RepID=A0ABM8ZM79_9VIBR|nr:TMAO reductase system sensor histidine kinase/response regulator TorS [Vibrio hippocampi]CAH0529568.1 Sensor protein TorS [Vibrio hippocampi]